jgi:hypothetical protein
MQPQDAVKLVYQNEFGCGHLLQDLARARAHLEREYAGAQAQPLPPLYEPIGNGFCRLHLAAAKAQGVSAADVFARFADSAKLQPGARAGLEQKLARLALLAEQSALPFSAGALQSYLPGYMARGCPAVSHSETYRAAYAPAYRVVKVDCGVLSRK